MKLIASGKLHVVKVPSTVPEFFPYCHYKDINSSGPIVEFLMDDVGSGCFRITGSAKLKPNIQKKPKNRIDIYGPHFVLVSFAQIIRQRIGVGIAVGESKVNPEASRIGPQTLPLIEKQYTIPLNSMRGKGASFQFSHAERMYFDHEIPNYEHIEMVGPEFHLGIPFNSIERVGTGFDIVEYYVPDGELRVDGETNPVGFSPLIIKLDFTRKQLMNFAETILQSHK